MNQTFRQPDARAQAEVADGLGLVDAEAVAGLGGDLRLLRAESLGGALELGEACLRGCQSLGELWRDGTRRGLLETAKSCLDAGR